jgi:hypothetical protein
MLAAIAALAFAFLPARAADTPDQRAFLDIYRELVEIDTTDSAGDTLRAAEAMAARLRAGGVPANDIRVLSSGPRKGIWWRGCAAPARASRFSFSPIST